jgi:hypothetical protein
MMIDIPPPAASIADTPAHERVPTHCRPKNGRKSPKRLLLRGGSKKPQNEDGVMTNMSEKDQLMSLLFEEDTQLVDLKFFRSLAHGASTATEEDICREFLSAIKQKKDGTADVSKNFNDDAQKVDVRALFRP